MADEKEIKVELPEAVTKALATIEELTGRLAKLEGVKPDADTALTTDLTAAQKEYAAIEKQIVEVRISLQKELEARTEELKASKAEIEKMHKQRRREKFITRARELEHLPGAPADDFAEMLDLVEQGLAKIAPDRAGKLFTKLNELLTSWNVVIEKNNVLFAEIGREGGDLGMLSGVEAQLEALTREKMATDPKLSRAKAYDLVLRDHPALYKKYVEQGRK